MFTVSQSSIKSWRRCRREYRYKNIENLEPKKPKPPLIYGTIVHEMIEMQIGGKDPFKVLKKYEQLYAKLWKEEREEYGDMIGDIRRTMTAYFKWYENDPLVWLQNKKTKKRSEHKGEVILADGIRLTFKVDGVARSKDGRIWLVDHKTTRELPGAEGYKYGDIQGVLYTKFLPEIGFPKVDGVCWNYIRKKPPAIPELLGNGELSKRQNIDTTWDVYLAEIKRHKLDPADYQDMKERLVGREHNFFVRTYFPVNDKIIKNVTNEAIMTAHEMEELSTEPLSQVRSIDKHCNWCQFFNLCQAELRGLDAGFIRKKDFKVRKDEDQIEVEEA